MSDEGKMLEAAPGQGRRCDRRRPQSAMDPAGAGVRAVDLTAALARHRSTTSRALGDLERLGLLARLPDPIRPMPGPGWSL